MAFVFMCKSFRLHENMLSEENVGSSSENKFHQLGSVVPKDSDQEKRRKALFAMCSLNEDQELLTP